MKTSKSSGRKAMLLTLQLFFVVVLLVLGVWIGSRPTAETSGNQSEASINKVIK
jgi:ABC-type Fe3+ transport system permease subunit